MKKLNFIKKFLNLIVFLKNFKLEKSYKILDKYENVILFTQLLVMKLFRKKKVAILTKYKK